MGIQHGEIMNGADDNASGSIGVLEIAEALVKSNLNGL
jgi:Zn-dependent M28 family amino/carboxypeptidase